MRKKELVGCNWPDPLFEKDFVRFPFYPSTENPAISTSIGRAFELPATCVRNELNKRQHFRFPLIYL
jgi:hypothetical protein